MEKTRRQKEHVQFAFVIGARASSERDEFGFSM
jgi:hypothetical protein